MLKWPLSIRLLHVFVIKHLLSLNVEQVELLPVFTCIEQVLNLLGINIICAFACSGPRSFHTLSRFGFRSNVIRPSKYVVGRFAVSTYRRRNEKHEYYWNISELVHVFQV